jgi:hypothetical protein
MGDDGSEKKSIGGHIAIALAAIGALFARTADDCGRVAIKGGAAFSDDAVRGAGRVGSLADDGVRSGSKLGSLADDGMHAGKYGPLAEDGMRNGARVPPHGETPGGLIEEARVVGTKAESHAGEAAEFGVDVSLEAISNAPSSDSDDDSEATPIIVGGQQVGSAQVPRFDTMALLRGRNQMSQPAMLPVVPTSTKAIQFILGHPDKPGDKSAFLTLRPIPDDGPISLDPFKWLKGRLSHNPISLVFYTIDKTGTQNPIPLVLPNGETTDDTAMHRACIEHFSHCILFVCKPEKAGHKELCAKTVVDAWQSITTSATDMSLQSLMERVVMRRAATPALRDVTISRIDVSTEAPRIVRSRMSAKKP